MQGIEFRSLTVEAWKGKQGPCFERNQAVIYKGPFKEVLDDDDHHLTRGVRHAVCDKTFQLFQKEPYREHFEFIEPLTPVPADEAQPFDCEPLRPAPSARDQRARNTTRPAQARSCCGSDGGCC